MLDAIIQRISFYPNGMGVNVSLDYLSKGQKVINIGSKREFDNQTHLTCEIQDLILYCW